MSRSPDPEQSWRAGEHEVFYKFKLDTAPQDRERLAEAFTYADRRPACAGVKQHDRPDDNLAPQPIVPEHGKSVAGSISCRIPSEMFDHA